MVIKGNYYFLFKLNKVSEKKTRGERTFLKSFQLRKASFLKNLLVKKNGEYI